MAELVLPINELEHGDKIKASTEDPWVEVIKWERDRYGYDLLYDPLNGNPPRWRGFDHGDTVLVHRTGERG